MRLSQAVEEGNKYKKPHGGVYLSRGNPRALFVGLFGLPDYDLYGCALGGAKLATISLEEREALAATGWAPMGNPWGNDDAFLGMFPWLGRKDISHISERYRKVTNPEDPYQFSDLIKEIREMEPDCDCNRFGCNCAPKQVEEQELVSA